MPTFKTTTYTAQPFAYVSRKARIADMPKVMAESFAKLSAAFGEAHAVFAGPPLTHYLAYDADTATFHVGFPARPEQTDALRRAGLEIGETASGPAMTARHTGPYDTLHETYAAMQAQMKSEGVSGTVDMWEIYMSPPETPPQQTVTEVIWPVKRITAAA